ncbi:hypothetical protein [Cypionkella sp.]|uniref:hypothetical protein n=1 Tax=Cypionkella sp. TaxID=2811411 RepID=UPI002722DBA8|nr:hypothetical protein [Cypionkella sp.]MDO8983349.1 hypothetical protein [Cypionkella sp.]MDP2050192.1 hypothetical protein [Cypionkella sp.]
MDLMMGLSAIKQTLDITKELRSIDDKIVVAEFKLRISDIVDRLLDAKQALIEAPERELELRNEVSELRSAQVLRAKLQDENGLLYEIGADGEHAGEPYCNLCFVTQNSLIRLRHHAAKAGGDAHYQCDNCKTRITTGPALPFPTISRRAKQWP